MSNKIVIAHGDCSDGLVGAWCFHKAIPDATFHFARYGSCAPPDVSGKEVYVVDFSYPRDVLIEMAAKANYIRVLDHHKSAQEALEGLDFCGFDMERSGAGLAWDHLFPDQERHWIVDYTEDRDLWRFDLPYSREVNAVLQSHPLTFDALYALEKKSWRSLVPAGEAILRSHQQLVNQICEKAREVEIQGYKILMANTSVLQSEVGSKLAEGRAFGVAYFENEVGDRVYSFRADKKSETDLTKIVAAYGGGGHRTAAGARLKAGESL